MSVFCPGRKNEGEQSADRRWCGYAAPEGPPRGRAHLRIAGDDRPVTQAGAPLGALLRLLASLFSDAAAPARACASR